MLICSISIDAEGLESIGVVLLVLKSGLPLAFGDRSTSAATAHCRVDVVAQNAALLDVADSRVQGSYGDGHFAARARSRAVSSDRVPFRWPVVSSRFEAVDVALDDR